MFRRTRVAFALGVVVLNVLATFGVTLILGVPCALLRKVPPFHWLWRGLEQIPHIWNVINWKVACEGILGMKLKELGPAPPLPEGTLRIFMANHPTFVGFAAFGYIVTGLLGNLIVLLMKLSVLWHPFVMFPAWCLKILRAGVFINRKNRDKAFASIRRAVQRLAGKLTCWVCFPDQHRPTLKRFRQMYEEFAKKIPGVRQLFTRVLVPRSGAILELWTGLRSTGVPVQLLDVTFGFEVENDTGFGSVLSLVGATFFVDFEDVTAEAEQELVSEETARPWLIKRWLRKEQILCERQGGKKQ